MRLSNLAQLYLGINNVVMRRKVLFWGIILAVCLLAVFDLGAQPFVLKGYSNPLDTPLRISGNFGELRTNAYHAGFDFKMSGIIGLNIYAVDDGYISRIKVDWNGFGKALYINHPNGTTSVYGHIEAFRDDIERYCRNEQYRLKQFGIDIALKPNDMPIKKAEVIAFGGTRGASSGPHLHFELRETKTQKVFNIPKGSNICIEDTVPPVMEKIWLYPMSANSIANKDVAPTGFMVQCCYGVNSISPGIISAYGDIGIGVQTYDLSNFSLNRVGVYSLELWVNNELIFEQSLDKLSFGEMRYVNSIIDYETYMRTGARVNRLFVQPNNRSGTYRKVENRGIVSLKETANKEIRVALNDDYGNTSECKFFLGSQPADTLLFSKRPKDIQSVLLMPYNTENTFEADHIKLFVPKDALYDNLKFEYSVTAAGVGYFSGIHRVHNLFTPLHRPCNLSLKPSDLSPVLFDKALLVSIDQAGSVLWKGGKYKDGFVVADIWSLGNYAVAIDTVPPQINPLFTNVQENNFVHWDRLAFNVKDALSGVSYFTGLIDGQWALFEFDPKQDLLFYKFDSEKIKFGQRHKLELYVWDEKNNKSEYTTEFYK